VRGVGKTGRARESRIARPAPALPGFSVRQVDNYAPTPPRVRRAVSRRAPVPHGSAERIVCLRSVCCRPGLTGTAVDRVNIQ
jgi:hypothetical protein